MSFFITPRGLRVIMVVGLLMLVSWFFWSARGAMFPFLLGAVLAFVIAPVVERAAVIQPWYARKPDLARGVAVITIYAIGLGAMIIAAIFFVPQIIDEVDQLIEDVPSLFDDARAQVDTWLEEYRDRVPEDVQQQVDDAMAGIGTEVGALIESVLERSLGIVFSTLAAVFGYIAVPFFVFYALKDRDRALGRFYSFFPENLRPDVRESVRIANQVLGSYVRAQLILALVIFTVTFIGLSLMGVDFALGLAVAAGFTELIPIIGPILGFVPAFIVVLATEPDKWWWVILFYIGVQAAENYLLVPRFHASSVHMHPAIVLIFLTAAGAVFGLWGVLVVVPIVAALRDVFAYIYRRLGEEDTRRKAAALPPPAPPD